MAMLCDSCLERSRKLKRFAPYQTCGTCRIGPMFCKCGNQAFACSNCAPRCDHGFVQGNNCITCNPAHFCACGLVKSSCRRKGSCNFAETTLRYADRFLPAKEMKKAPEHFNLAGNLQRFLCPECSFDEWPGGSADKVRLHVLRHHPEYPGAAEHLALHPQIFSTRVPTTRPQNHGRYLNI